MGKFILLFIATLALLGYGIWDQETNGLPKKKVSTYIEPAGLQLSIYTDLETGCQ